MTTKFDRAKAQPGEDIDLRITADPNSFVAILAVDMSTTLNGGSNDLTVSQVQKLISSKCVLDQIQDIVASHCCIEVKCTCRTY